MGDILKEAIADAKAVRETALQNAKMALEEAFTPQLKSMLSAKLREEEDEEGAEEGYMEDEEMDAEEMAMKDEDEEMSAEEGEHETEEGEHETPEEMKMEDEDEMDAEEMAKMEDDEMDAEEGEDKLDLESIIRELEDELKDEDEETVDEQDDAYDEKASAKRSGLSEDENGDDDDDDDDDVEIDESLFTEEDDAYDEDAENNGKEENKSPIFKDKKVKTEQSDSSKIGTGDNKGDYADSGDEEDPGDSTDVYSELKEYKEAVHFLKDKLHEVNILNAKLLFTNKLFKSFSLDNNQKLKVVETFDRAQTTREIKLVYSTLAEQFGDNSSIVTKKSISESASSAVSSTKPSKESRKVISEETQVADRFRKLAGLIK